MKSCWLIIALILSLIISQQSSVLSHASFPRVLSQSATGSDGTLYINPLNTTRLPVGSEFNVSVQASGVSYFDGWDVLVQTNSSVISAVNMSIAGDLFLTNNSGHTPSPIIVTKCINGQVIVGPACNPLYPGTLFPGVAELSVAFYGTPTLSPVPAYGPVFNITYKVLDPQGFSTIDFLNATLVNAQQGQTVSLNIATQGGVYGTVIARPDFAVTATPSSPVVIQGTSVNVSIYILSTDLFQGGVRLNVSSPVPGPTLSFDFTTLNLKPNSSNTTILTIYANASLPAQLYTLIVLASGGGRSHVISLPVLAQLSPFFQLSLSPSLLKVHAGDSANTTVNVQGEDGFFGNVNLTIAQSPNRLGLAAAAALSSTNVTVRPDSSVSSTLLSIVTPVVSLSSTYNIHVIATGIWNKIPLRQNETLVVVPPPASVSITFTPATLTIRAGSPARSTIHVSSVDFFWGPLYVSAVMSGGAVSFNSSLYYIPLPNSTHASYAPWQSIGMTVSVTASTPPGNYLALLTVYSLQNGPQAPTSKQIAVPITVDPPILQAASILGLSVPVYFGILGALAVPLVLLSIQTYRKREKEDDDWRK